MASGRLLLRSARLIDGTGAPARDGASILVEGATDVVVVDGDPLRDIGVLQDRGRLSVIQGGRFVTRSFA